jgi:hypothetical protein
MSRTRTIEALDVHRYSTEKITYNIRKVVKKAEYRKYGVTR